jgi:hypothetical protein
VYHLSGGLALNGQNVLMLHFQISQIGALKIYTMEMNKSDADRTKENDLLFIKIIHIFFQ